MRLFAGVQYMHLRSQKERHSMRRIHCFRHERERCPGPSLALQAGTKCEERQNGCSRAQKHARILRRMGPVRLSRVFAVTLAQEVCFFKQKHGSPTGSKQEKTDELLSTVLSPMVRRRRERCRRVAATPATATGCATPLPSPASVAKVPLVIPSVPPPSPTRKRRYSCPTESNRRCLREQAPPHVAARLSTAHSGETKAARALRVTPNASVACTGGRYTPGGGQPLRSLKHRAEDTLPTPAK